MHDDVIDVVGDHPVDELVLGLAPVLLEALTGLRGLHLVAPPVEEPEGDDGVGITLALQGEEADPLAIRRGLVGRRRERFDERLRLTRLYLGDPRRADQRLRLLWWWTRRAYAPVPGLRVVLTLS